MNQIIECPFCHDQLLAHTVTNGKSYGKIGIAWCCYICNCDIDRWFDYTKELMDELSVINAKDALGISFRIVDDNE